MWRIVLAFWKLAAFRNAPIRDAFFRLVLLSSHYPVNRPDSAKWRKGNALAGCSRLVCLRLGDVDTGEQLLPGEGRIISLPATGALRVAAAWQRAAS